MANQIGTLMDQMPIANQEAAEQAEAARQIRLQQQLSQMSPGQAMMAGPAAAQQMGAQASQQQAQIATQAQAAQGQQAIQEAKRAQQQADLAEKKTAMIEQDMLNRRRIEQESQLNRLGRDVKAELMDSRRQFEKDARGERFANQRQLADYMVLNAKSQEEFAGWAQQMEQDLQTDVAMMEQAYRVFENEERRLLESGEAARDRASLDRIRKKKAALEEEQNKARKKASQFKKVLGAAKIVGGVVIAVASWGTAGSAGVALAASGASDIASADQ